MANEFVPLSLEKIEEGQFLEDANSALLQLQNILVKHVRRYGDNAKKAKAVLTLKVGLICIDPERDMYAIAANTTTSLPSAPPFTDYLLPGKSEDGSDVLECRRSGATGDDPRQKVFATRDGRPVDLETGEVITLEEDSEE